MDKNLAFWRTNLFTNESIIERGVGGRRQYVFRPKSLFRPLSTFRFLRRFLDAILIKLLQIKIEMP